MDRLVYRDGHVILVRHHLAERTLLVLDGTEELRVLRDMQEEDDTGALLTIRTADQWRAPAGSLETAARIGEMIRRTPFSGNASSSLPRAR